jgi:aryl-alcohol dehydrogenase-like predicted oxidoreductase
MLHRDNLDVPVLEFMEVMQSVQNEGLVGSYGFSNWSLPRVRQASMIAAQGGHAGLTAISNHLSILDMVEPVHPGTCSSRGHKWESWLRDSGMSLVPWASQGRGVFTLTDAVELRQSVLGRHWWSEDNEERLRRALRIAPKYGISATGLALQWVLCRPIDVYPIIGPRTPDELRDSLKALEVTIDIADLDWVEQV